MELHQLRYFVAVVEEGSFSRAAARLHVAQPSLSQQIQKLEVELGQPLLDRLPRAVVPTEAGRRFFEHARRILAQVNDAARCVRDGRDAPSGRVVLGAIPTIAPALLPRLIRRFATQHPQVTVEVVEEVTDRLLVRLEEGSVDLALISDAHPHTAIHVEALADEPLRLAVPATHPLARRPRARWADLHEQTALVLDELHCLAGQVAEFCRAADLRWNVRFRGAHLGTILEMVAGGLGVSLVPEMFRELAEARGCRLVRLSEPQPRRRLCLAQHNLRYRTRAALALAAMIRELCAAFAHERKARTPAAR
ncbi:MAG: LysR substrate-binding domain-containing protein [Verrucomicrobiae bacterium]|nr:LysR substrate-binding domain-containing protein [Verrucomicrobiae bacterium]MDW8308685.1 LysR substrate-binding domain-containing protein [Verrucomicrobiales bacterium]